MVGDQSPRKEVKEAMGQKLSWDATSANAKPTPWEALKLDGPSELSELG